MHLITQAYRNIQIVYLAQYSWWALLMLTKMYAYLLEKKLYMYKNRYEKYLFLTCMQHLKTRVHLYPSCISASALSRYDSCIIQYRFWDIFNLNNWHMDTWKTKIQYTHLLINANITSSLANKQYHLNWW